MKSIIRFALGAAIAGVLVRKLLEMQERGRAVSSRGERFADAGPDSSYDERVDRTAAQPGDEVVADTNGIGEQSSQQGEQPQDWRGAQNVVGP